MKLQKYHVLGIILLSFSGFLASVPYRHGNPDSLRQAFLSPFISFFVLSLWLTIFGNSPRHRRLIKVSLIIGAGISLVSFIAGFVGPIIFMPEANQGPLLGIFFTGPLGLAGGIILGIPISFVIDARKRRKAEKLL